MLSFFFSIEKCFIMRHARNNCRSLHNNTNGRQMDTSDQDEAHSSWLGTNAFRVYHERLGYSRVLQQYSPRPYICSSNPMPFCYK